MYSDLTARGMQIQCEITSLQTYQEVTEKTKENEAIHIIFLFEQVINRCSSNADVRLHDGFVSQNVLCVRLGNYRVINSYHVVAWRHDRLHIAPLSIIIYSSQCA